MTYPEIFDAVIVRLKAYAQEQYSSGWDSIVECWEREDYIDALKTVVTSENLTNEDALFEAAKTDIQQFVTIYDEQRSNTRFE